jgi:hypothetical protein
MTPFAPKYLEIAIKMPARCQVSLAVAAVHFSQHNGTVCDYRATRTVETAGSVSLSGTIYDHARAATASGRRNEIMTTTDHLENVHDNAKTPAPPQAQGGQIVSEDAQEVGQDARRVPKERTLRVVVQAAVQEPHQPTPFQRSTVISESVRDVIRVIGGSRGAEVGHRS